MRISRTFRNGCVSLATIFLGVLCLQGTSRAELINSPVQLPYLGFNSQGTTVYTPYTSDPIPLFLGQISVKATPLSLFTGTPPPIFYSPGSTLLLDIQTAPNGALVGGVPADDLSVKDASGNVLLTGEILAYGYQDTLSSADSFDFLFQLTGGSLAGLYPDQDLGVTLAVEYIAGTTQFNGDFNQPFNGGAKGQIGGVCIEPVMTLEKAISTDNGTTWLNADNPPGPDVATCSGSPEDSCEKCDGNITKLSLGYLGTTTKHVQVNDAANRSLFSGYVSKGEVINLVGKDSMGTLTSFITLKVNFENSTKIMTDCSSPVGPGLVVGKFSVVSGENKWAKALCPVTCEMVASGCGCQGGVTSLNLQYTGQYKTTFKVVNQKNDILFKGDVSRGESINLSANGTTLTEKISIYTLQYGCIWKLHTSIKTDCSMPIGPGLESGNFMVVAGTSSTGAALCSMDNQDGKIQVCKYQPPICEKGVLFKYTATNTGRAPLRDILLTDTDPEHGLWIKNMCDDMGFIPGSLAPTMSFACIIGPDTTPTVGQHFSTGKVTAKTSCASANAEDPVYYNGTELPCGLSLEKFVSPDHINCTKRNCTYSPGYWKNHPEAWPVATILIGNRNYTKKDAIAYMAQSVSGDKTFTLFPALVAAKLNILINGDSGPINDVITAANKWMTTYPLASKITGDSMAWKQGEPLYLKLDTYNNSRKCDDNNTCTTTTSTTCSHDSDSDSDSDSSCNRSSDSDSDSSCNRSSDSDSDSHSDSDSDSDSDSINCPLPSCPVENQVVYTYKIINTGPPLTQVTVKDDKLGDIASYDTLPGYMTEPLVIKKKACVTEKTTNVATAMGYLPTGKLCGDTAEATVTSGCPLNPPPCGDGCNNDSDSDSDSHSDSDTKPTNSTIKRR